VSSIIGQLCSFAFSRIGQSIFPDESKAYCRLKHNLTQTR
jgi:hypothetical protein